MTAPSQIRPMPSERTRQLDLFVMQLSDVDLRDQHQIMERPFFALSKNRKTPISYVSPKGDNFVKISPNVSHGMASIWDSDILVWAAGQINKIVERNDKAALAKLHETRTLRFNPADLLKSIDRSTGGRDREELRASLRRLNSTYIETSIRQHHLGSTKLRGFNWIDSWDEEVDDYGHTKSMEITLSNWFFMGAVDQRLLLSLEFEYFSLKGGYERWLYRIARKHAHGSPEGWTFDLSTLHEKSGSDQPMAGFKRDLRKVIERGPILGYGFEWIERGNKIDPQVRIYPLEEYERNQFLAGVHERSKTQKKARASLLDNPQNFKELAHPEKLRNLQNEFPNVDLEDMFNRFVAWNKERGARPRDVYKAFAGFIETHRERQKRKRTSY